MAFLFISKFVHPFSVLSSILGVGMGWVFCQYIFCTQVGLMHLASVSPHKQFLLLRQTARQTDVGRDWGEGEGRGGEISSAVYQGIIS